MNQSEITDSIYMGPWMADTIRKCDGLVDMMSYWTFSDVFEEQGVIKTPFYGGYGLIAEDGIPKPAFNVFADLHELGDERIQVAQDDVLVTRRKDGTLVIAAWNLVEPGASGAEKTIQLTFNGMRAGKAIIHRVDAQHGDTLAAWNQMGKPSYLTKQQIDALKKASDPGAPETVSLKDHVLTLKLPPSGLAVVEIR